MSTPAPQERSRHARPAADPEQVHVIGPRGDVDAVDGTPQATRVRLAFGEVSWEVMLAEHHVREIKTFLNRFTVHAHRVAGAHYPGLADPVRLRPAQSAATPPPRFDAPTIRAWGISNGWQVPSRGRIPKALREAYRAAMQTGVQTGMQAGAQTGDATDRAAAIGASRLP